MALNKTITDPETGASCSYWRILPDFTVNAADAVVTGTLVAYVDDKARSNNLSYVQAVGVTCALDAKTGDQRKALYEAAKALPDLKGAKDV